MKRPLLALCSVLSVAIVAAVLLSRPKEKACSKLESKLALSEDFCQGLAERAAEERCSQLSEDPQVMGQCMRVIVPAAHSSCMGYLNIERLKGQHHDLCS